MLGCVCCPVACFSGHRVVNSRVDVVVMAFGIDRAMIERLTQCGVFVFVMVGTGRQARRAIAWGADGLIAQGCEAGGHLAGVTRALTFLPEALEVAAGRPVLLAGGVATAQDTRAALAAGADGVVAGTRFLLTHESRAHPEYQRRILAADKTIRTTLFGMGWPAPHRVVANAATRRWCHDDGHARLLPRIVNAGSGLLPKPPDRAATSVIRLQAPALPLFSPIAPTAGMSTQSWTGRRCTQVKPCCGSRCDLGPAGCCRSGAGRTMKSCPEPCSSTANAECAHAHGISC